MIKFSYLTLVVFFSMAGVASTQAGSLDKYGDKLDSQSVQKVEKSSREIAIERAVQDIKNSDPAKRSQLIREYSIRTKAALNNGNTDEARFYSDILSRSGN